VNGAVQLGSGEELQVVSVKEVGALDLYGLENAVPLHLAQLPFGATEGVLSLLSAEQLVAWWIHLLSRHVLTAY